MVFQGDVFDEERCFKMYRFDLIWCIKLEWGEHVPLVVDIICNPGCIRHPRRLKRVEVHGFGNHQRRVN